MSIVVRPMLLFRSLFPHLMHSFFIVVFSGIDLALLARASHLDLILFMNLIDLSIALLAFTSTFCNELLLGPKSPIQIDLWLPTLVFIE